MAWLRVLVMLFVIGGVANAKRRPPSDPDLIDSRPPSDRILPRMRPPPLDDEARLKRGATIAMARSRASVQACAKRFGSPLDALPVRVVIGYRRVDVIVPSKGARPFQTCVRDVVQRAVRGIVFTRPHAAVLATYTFKIDREVDAGFSQPPP